MVSKFVAQLFLEAHVVMETDAAASQHAIDQGIAQLLVLEQDYRKTLPGTPPAPDAAAVGWGLKVVYRIAQLLAYRHLDASDGTFFAVPASISPNPTTCYSVDLLFRFLPGFARLARQANVEPFGQALRSLGEAWPLSSVGMGGIGECPVAGFIGDPALKMLYVDRILKTGDMSRLSETRVRDAVQAAIGLHVELAPEFVAFLEMAI